MKYLQEYKHTLEFEDEKIFEFVKVKKKGNYKTYIKAQCLVYMEKIRKCHAKFLSSIENVHCSFSTFFKYKRFYITAPKKEKKNPASA